MTSLYALIAKIVAALLVLGGLVFWGYTLGEKHVQSAWDTDKAAQTAALAKAQSALIDAQAAHDKVVQDAEADHEKLVADNATIATDFAGRVRSLESALRLRPVPSAVGAPGKPVGTGPGTGSDPNPERKIAELNAAIGSAIAACQHDSAELTGILEVAPR